MVKTISSHSKDQLPKSISWQAHEFEHTPKGAGWNGLVIGLTLIFLVWRLWALDFSGSVLAFLAGFTFLLYSHKRPRELTFALKPNGIAVGPDFHHFHECESFWVFYHPPHVKELAIKTKKFLEPRLHLPLDRQNPVLLRRYLLQYLPEEEQHYSFVDGIMRAIGF